MSTILNEIRQLLSALTAQTSWDRASDDDRFEGYAFALVLKAAVKEGAIVQFENRDGPFNGTATFRTSPGHLWADKHPYTHAIIQFPGRPALEAHVGVYVCGRSTLYHEADVVVLSRAVARTCRVERTDPFASDSILILECKFYSSDPGVSLGREFLGLSAECGKEGTLFVTNRPAPRLQKMFQVHDREWGQGILPSQPNDVDRLVGFAQRAFTRFKAKR
jgi:hypothetical protein